MDYRPKAIKAKNGVVTIPEPELSIEQADGEIPPVTEHTAIQALLLQLGSKMGFNVWVARNDRGRKYNGLSLGDFPKMKNELPLKFDDATNKTIELIDVLWLQGNAIIAAFEVESTTSIYSGLLRMSDLISMQPNINIPLYLVAPEDKREKVFSEVNRPTFSKLNPPLSSICKYISFIKLKDQMDKAASFLEFLRYDFLDKFSETCNLEKF